MLASFLMMIVSPIISLLILFIFISVIMSWLVSFNIMNLNNQMVRQIYYAIESITQPILKPIRQILPSVGGLDFSPIIALLGLNWINAYVIPALAQAVS